MVAVGIATVTWTTIQDPDPGRVGVIVAILGAVTVAYALLEKRAGPIHDAWLDGRDVGREEGFEEGFEKGRKAKPERPVLIDLAEARIERERING
jgi:hypothetical protein